MCVFDLMTSCFVLNIECSAEDGGLPKGCPTTSAEAKFLGLSELEKENYDVRGHCRNIVVIKQALF